TYQLHVNPNASSVDLYSSCLGISRRKTRIYALMTRASIKKHFTEEDGLQRNSGPARVPQHEAPQVGQARLAVSSPAMTADGSVFWTNLTPHRTTGMSYHFPRGTFRLAS